MNQIESSRLNNIEARYSELRKRANHAFAERQKIRWDIIRRVPKLSWIRIGWKSIKDFYRTEAIPKRRSRTIIETYRTYAPDHVKKEVHFKILVDDFPLLVLANYLKTSIPLESKDIKQLIKLNEQRKKQLTIFTPFTAITFLLTAIGLISKTAPKEFFEWIRWDAGYKVIQIGVFLALVFLYLIVLPLPLWKYLKLKYQYESLERLLNYCEILELEGKEPA
jgi:hypothetical protein